MTETPALLPMLANTNKGFSESIISLTSRTLGVIPRCA
jgi:hypothetical protein